MKNMCPIKALILDELKHYVYKGVMTDESDWYLLPGYKKTCDLPDKSAA